MHVTKGCWPGWAGCGKIRCVLMLWNPTFPGRFARKVCASVCLMTMVLLWSPFWAAAWQAASMNCCEGGMCAAHSHSNQNKQTQETKSDDSPMTCEHHGGNRLSQCKMACCQESSQVVTAGVIFLLPDPASISEPQTAMDLTASFAPWEFPQSVEPLSPPPRVVLTSL
jgi:hypothetical protein